ncbi:MAG TPA: DUF6506 family protein [Steroidobacteraceae bacterium]|nr:DUF6506 family protein [Steroidobacteraceae bacterium]
MKKWGFIYTLGDPAAKAKTDTIGSAACMLVCVGVPNVADAPQAALQLLAQEVQLIELCGAFSGAGLAAVVDAVKGRVPVGAVFYGGEASTGLHKLFG